MCKKLTRQTPFQLVYGMEVVRPMEYIVPSLRIIALTGMTDHEALEERLTQLEELEQEWFLDGFHQQVQKQCEKAWHNRHIKLRTFKVNDLVLLYDSKFEKFLGKFRIHWLGPFGVKEVTNGGATQLVKLNGEPFPSKVNNSLLKPYMGGPTLWLTGWSIVFVTWGARQGHRTINTGIRCQYQGKDMIHTWMIQKQECSRASKSQNSASWNSEQYGTSWRGFAPSSPHQ